MQEYEITYLSYTPRIQHKTREIDLINADSLAYNSGCVEFYKDGELIAIYNLKYVVKIEIW